MRLPKNINLIVACQKSDWGIAMNGSIPWRSPKDLTHFREITSKVNNSNLQNAVIMGRKTFDTIGRPLPGRLNYVISRNINLQSDLAVRFMPSLSTALQESTSNPLVENVFVIGGEDIYNQTLKDWNRYIEKTFLTLIDTHHPCDQFLNRELIEQLHYPVGGQVRHETNGIELTFKELQRRNVGEEQYLDLLRRIITEGEIRPNRTGVDTLSIFGERLVFDISERVPFLTTKRLAWKTMLRELLWFVNGDTNNKHLQEKNVHIWDGNGSREYLDSIGLTNRQEGDLGPVYGFQWRHFGAEYIDCDTDYTGQGVDQLAQIVEQLRTDRQSRRIILSAWNPSVQGEMALPPCHVLAQWYVSGDYLDCQMYQRSCDVALGVPFNIASYSVLTYMLAHLAGLQPGRYIQVMGDAHVYTNHIDAVKKQLTRTPFIFPRLKIICNVDNIDDFREEDFCLENYKCYEPIKMDMVV